MHVRMKKVNILLLGLWSIVLLSSFVSPKRSREKDEEVKRVYLYGVSIDFNDSVVYMTDIQYLDSMIIQKDGSLQGQAGYSHQMKLYLEGELGEDNQTCAVIYSDDKRKMEKKFLKMRKMYQAEKNYLLKILGVDAFAFRKE